MRKIREVLRLKWIAEASGRQIAKSCNIARSTVKEYLKRAQDAGLTWGMIIFSPQASTFILISIAADTYRDSSSDIWIRP